MSECGGDGLIQSGGVRGWFGWLSRKRGGEGAWLVRWSVLS